MTGRGKMTFEFYRLRLHLRAVEAVQFRAGGAGNALRGAFGSALRQSAAPAEWGRLFEPGTPPGGRAPSGLRDWPRPFVFRAAHLDGAQIAAGSGFHFDVHLFDMQRPSLDLFRAAVAALAAGGLGAGRGRAELERIDRLDLAGHAETVGDAPGEPLAVDLDPEPPASRVRVRFATPTEWKSGGAVTERPEFAVLLARVRDRLSTLRALYGAGPLAIDFRELGRRAEAVRLVDCDLVWEAAGRRSGRTGQVHSIGGFTGEAEYAGPLGEFLPWLRAARWIGVGRQTVWGKGDVRVVWPTRPCESLEDGRLSEGC